MNDAQPTKYVYDNNPVELGEAKLSINIDDTEGLKFTVTINLPYLETTQAVSFQALCNLQRYIEQQLVNVDTAIMMYRARQEPDADANRCVGIVRQCMICTERYTVNVNAKSFIDWQNGVCVQEAFPTLSAPEREQIKTGIHPECWATLTGE